MYSVVFLHVCSGAVKNILPNLGVATWTLLIVYSLSLSFRTILRGKSYKTAILSSYCTWGYFLTDPKSGTRPTRICFYGYVCGSLFKMYLLHACLPLNLRVESSLICKHTDAAIVCGHASAGQLCATMDFDSGFHWSDQKLGKGLCTFTQGKKNVN